jgi:uncharacterized membrane-anchored protein
MTDATLRVPTHSRARELLNKVPEITIYFWVIKVLCTTVGETAADFLNVNLNLGLTVTSIVMAILLGIALVFQVRGDRYVPWMYWLAVALISVVGTLVTDNLSENLGVPLEVTTVVFTVVLGGVFAWWYSTEGTLSIHSIVTTRREGFYWLTILFTFALGTAAGDLMAEVLGLGYLVTGIIVALLIAAAAAAWRFGLNPVLAFWIIYILTRPLGASIGDGLTQPADQGGLGLGATTTSVIFSAGIVLLVIYLSITKADVIAAARVAKSSSDDERGGLRQTVIVVTLVLVVGLTGYWVRKNALIADTSAPTSGQTAQQSPLGDLSAFQTITQDTLNLVDAGNQPGATGRVTDLETAWDNSEARLKPKDPAAWHDLDDKIDAVLRALRSTQPDPPAEKAALTTLLTALAPPSHAGITQQSPLGDVSGFQKITQDTMGLLNAGNQAGATARIADLETSWDNSEARLKPKNEAAWTHIDDKIDTVLRELRSTNPQPASETAALTDLLAALGPATPRPLAPRSATPQPVNPHPTGLVSGSAPVHTSPLGDMSGFRKITQDTLDLLNAGNQAGATARVADLETNWDNSEARLKPKNEAAWTDIDDKIDTVLRRLRATRPDPNAEKAALTSLLGSLK